MRLREKRNLLVTAKPYLEIRSTPKPAHGQTVIHSFIMFKDAIETLGDTELFEGTIDSLSKLNFWDAYSESVSVDDDAFNKFKIIIDKLKINVDLLIDSLDEIIKKDNEFTISIKIPSPKTFGDLTEVSRSLDLIFGQTLYHPEINGYVEIQNFDMGSFWIDIVVQGGAQVMTFIGTMAWSGAVVYKKFMDALLVKEQIRELKISNDTKELTLNGIDDKQKEVATNEAQHVAELNLTDYTADDVNRIALAITEISKLYAKGGEIRPSIEAPKEIKEEFPKPERLGTIDSKIKMISENSQEQEESETD